MQEVQSTSAQAAAACQAFRADLRILARRAGGDDAQAEEKVSDFNECVLLAMASVQTTWPPYNDAEEPPGHPAIPLGLYRHYKGGFYTATGVVFHHESRQPMVLYISHAHATLNVRSLFSHRGDPEGWTDMVVDSTGATCRRFEYVASVTAK